MITPRVPYPPLKGDQVIYYNRIKVLSKNHQITLLTFYENDTELKNLSKITPFCSEVISVKLPLYKSYFNVLKGIFSEKPLQVSYYNSRIFKEKLNQLLEKNTYDIVHFHMLRLGEYGLSINNTPKIIELIDSMILNMSRRIKVEGYFKSLLLKEELKRLIKYEKYIAEKYMRSIVVAEEDKKTINASNTKVISLAVDTDSFNAINPILNNYTLVFSGNMSYFPNENAIIWFIEKCFPLIKNKFPSVKLKIAGANPSKKLFAYLGDDSIKITGFVDNLAIELQNSQIAIAPMQVGSGMQFKVLQALACGLPVVATSLGKGSISDNGYNIFKISDTPEEFANSCLELLTNFSACQDMSLQAVSFIKNHYSWEINCKKLEHIYEEVCDNN